jgi:hypothetical protein
MDTIYDLYNSNNIENFCQEEYNIFLSNFTSLIINYYSDSSNVKDVNTIFNIEESLKKAYKEFKLINLELNNINLAKNFIFNKILNINKNLILTKDNIVCILYIINKNIKDIETNAEIFNKTIFNEIIILKNNLNEKIIFLKDNKYKYKTKLKNFIETINDKFIELNIEIDDKIKNIKINSEYEINKYINNYNIDVYLLQKQNNYLLIIFIIISLINTFNICLIFYYT